MIWFINKGLLLLYSFFSTYYYFFIKNDKTILRKNRYKISKGLDKLRKIKQKNILKIKDVKNEAIRKDKNQASLLSLEKTLFTKYIIYTGSTTDDLPVEQLGKVLRYDLKLTGKILKQLRKHIVNKNNLKETVRKRKNGKSYRCVVGIKKSINNDCIHSSIG